MLRLRRNDNVMVISGKDKGKQGKVLRVFPSQQRAIVENINVVKKARRKTQQDQQGGIVDMETPIHISNLMLVDKQTSRPSRFRTSALKDGTRIRESKRSGEVM